MKDLPMMSRELVVEKVLRAVAHSAKRGTRTPAENHHMVEDLGFDSLRMATLSIALEEEFDAPVLLNDWIASSEDRSRLTVSSLADYVMGLLDEVA